MPLSRSDDEPINQGMEEAHDLNRPAAVPLRVAGGSPDVLALAAEALPCGLAVFGPDLRYRFANGHLRTLHGVDPVGLHASEVLPVELAGPVTERLAEVMRTGRTIPDVALRGTTRNAAGERVYAATFFAVELEPGQAGAGVLVRDVTETHDTEAALHEAHRELGQSERRFRELLENVQLAATITDGDSRIVFANEHLARLTGYSVDELLGSSWLELLVPPGMRDGEDAFYRELKRSGTFSPHDVGVPLLTRAGDVRLMTWSNTAVRDEHGAVWAVAGVGEDITERLSAQRELEDQRYLYQTLVEQLPMLIYRDTVDGDTGVYVGPQLTSMFGITPEEWFAPQDAAGWWEAFVHPDDLVVLERQGIMEKERRNEAYQAQYRMRCGDGSYRWIHDQVAPLLDGEGRPRFRQGLVQDITDRVNAERELESQRHLYQTLVEQLPVISFVTDTDGSPVYVSPQLEDVLGLTREQWSEMSPSERMAFVHPEDRPAAEAKVAPVYRGQAESYDVQVRMLTQTQELRYVHLKAAVVRDADGVPTAVQGAMIDVTALRVAERRSREVMAALVNAVEAEQARIATELHDDTVQLMTALLMKVRMLMPEHPQLESFEPLLAEALERTRRLMFELRPQILDGAGVAVALREVASEGPWDELVFDIQVPRQSDTTETLVYRSLRELIINARKHSKATRLEVRGRQHDAYLTFDVEDNGIGFDVAEALDRTHRRLHLGLDATIERARLAGGSLSIDSTPGNGARLRLTLPVDPAARLRKP